MARQRTAAEYLELHQSSRANTARLNEQRYQQSRAAYLAAQRANMTAEQAASRGYPQLAKQIQRETEQNRQALTQGYGAINARYDQMGQQAQSNADAMMADVDASRGIREQDISDAYQRSTGSLTSNLLSKGFADSSVHRSGQLGIDQVRARNMIALEGEFAGRRNEVRDRAQAYMQQIGMGRIGSEQNRIAAETALRSQGTQYGYNLGLGQLNATQQAAQQRAQIAAQQAGSAQAYQVPYDTSYLTAFQQAAQQQGQQGPFTGTGVSTNIRGGGGGYQPGSGMMQQPNPMHWSNQRVPLSIGSAGAAGLLGYGSNTQHYTSPGTYSAGGGYTPGTGIEAQGSGKEYTENAPVETFPGYSGKKGEYVLEGDYKDYYGS